MCRLAVSICCLSFKAIQRVSLHGCGVYIYIVLPLTHMAAYKAERGGNREDLGCNYDVMREDTEPPSAVCLKRERNGV